MRGLLGARASRPLFSIREKRAGETPALPGPLHPGYEPCAASGLPEYRRDLNDKER
jgi:hypothetical protein